MLDEMTDVSLKLQAKAKGDSSLSDRSQGLSKAVDSLHNFLSSFRSWLVDAEAVDTDSFVEEKMVDICQRIESALAHQDGAKAAMKRAKALL